MTVPTDSRQNGVQNAPESIKTAQAAASPRTDLRTALRAIRPTWPPTAKVLEALKNLERDNFRSFAYSENELHRALAEFCGLPVNYLQTYAGADVALEAICRAYLEPGVEILIASPTMSRICHHADSFGVRMRRVNSPTPFDVNVDDLIREINEFTRLIYIGQPSLPGGAILGEAEARYFLDNSGRAMVIIDESALMMRQYSLAALARKYRNLLVVRSFDGVYGLDAQPFGFILSHPDNLKMLLRYRLGHSPHVPADIAASSVLADMDRVDERINNIHENMLYLTARLRTKAMSCRMIPSGHILIKTEKPFEIAEILRRRGISVQSLEAFEGFRDYIMVPVESDDFSARLMEAFEETGSIIGPGEFRIKGRITLKAKGYETRHENVP